MLRKCSNLLFLSHIQLSTLDCSPQPLPSSKTTVDLKQVRGVEEEEEEEEKGEEEEVDERQTKKQNIVEGGQIGGKLFRAAHD